MAVGRAGILDRSALAADSPHHVQTRDAVGVARGAGNRSLGAGLALQDVGECERRNQCDHREPRDPVAQRRSTISDA